MTIGFLYNGYERRCYYWEALAMSRKTLLRVGTIVPYHQVKVLCLLGLSLGFLGMHMAFVDSTALNTLAYLASKLLDA